MWVVGDFNLPNARQDPNAVIENNHANLKNNFTFIQRQVSQEMN
jgi:hypothetical protein